MAKSSRVNKRLERRTDLPVRRSQRPIEFALRVITATHERADAAACIIDHHCRAFEVWHGRIPFSVLWRFILSLGRVLEVGLVFYFAQLRLQRILRGVLH